MPGDDQAMIVILDYPGAQRSAILGMQDMFAFARQHALVQGGAFPDATARELPPEAALVVIIPPALSLSPPTLPDGWSKRLHSLQKDGSLLASVCSGAFLLAQAGRLDGRTATTHWMHAAEFRKRHPRVIVDTDRLLLDQGDIVTAGGVMAWTDLALHLIERFGSRGLMLTTAKMFVIDPPERDQNPYATFAPDLSHNDAAIRTIQILLAERPAETHATAALASAAAMSERTFLRRFGKATGLSPIAYLQNLRVQAARSRLELSRASVEQISWELGYSDVATFRRVFKRIVGLSPADYRRRFGAPSALPRP
jgi:transcriptional regulator GlxA family with amidase domain